MRVEVTRTTPIYRSPQDTGIFLQWVVHEPGSSAITNIKIERSGSPEGPFELVIDKLTGAHFHFFDNLRHVPVSVSGTRENLNFLSLTRHVYYQLSVTNAAGETATTIREVDPTLPTRQRLLKRKILRDEGLAFRKLNGVELAVLKRRHWGERCTVCFDKLTKKVTNSKCMTCYGTGFTGGYFTPIRIMGRFGATNVQTQITPQGNADVGKSRVIILDYPQIEVYDFIVDVRANKRYVVETVHQTELRTVTVHQELTVSEVSRDSIEYRIPVNTDNAPVIY
jgi:hypothetical protein